VVHYDLIPNESLTTKLKIIYADSPVEIKPTHQTSSIGLGCEDAQQFTRDVAPHAPISYQKWWMRRDNIYKF
jgi:hypothetical protein